MGIARIANTCGYVIDANPLVLLEGIPPDVGTARRIVKLLTLYNPNTAAVTFTLRYAWADSMGERQTYTRFRDSIPTVDSWVFGSLGAIMVLDLSSNGEVKELEIVLTAAPTLPIEYGIDYADAT